MRRLNEHRSTSGPRLPLALLHLLLPRNERDEVLDDLRAEFAEHATRDGQATARRWLWRQALGSAPSLLGWTWWRGWTGFEPRANAYRPGGSMLQSSVADARYAARRLRARPVYTAMAVLTLALGIGGTAAVFGVARPLLFEPLPYAHAAEVATLWMPFWWSEEEFLYLRGRFPGFREMAAHRTGDVTLRQGDAPTRLIPGIVSSWELFDVLGARPLLGRAFRQGDDATGAEPVAVISYQLWQELGGQPSIIGARVTLDGTPQTVVGVMPRGFWFPDPAIRIWRTQALDPHDRSGNYALLGRVSPGQHVENMEPQARRLASMLAERFKYPVGGDKTMHPAITPLRDELLGAMRPSLVATLVAMGLILLIACANVAALMLGQVEGRASELAIRAALGASRGRLIQQLVIEAVMVGLGAGAIGAALAAVGIRVLAGALPIGSWAEGAAFDWRTFIMALAIALVAVLLVVVVPVVSLWRGDLRGALTRARTGGIQGRGGRLERGLVVTEVALAMLIASAAALLVRSVANLYAINPGVDTRGVAVVDLASGADLTSVQRGRAIQDVVAALNAQPGVRSAAATMVLPLRSAGNSFDIAIEGQPDAAPTFTYYRMVTADYFATMGIRLLDGRLFDISDRPLTDDSTDRVVVINQALAKKYFPGENPIGQRIHGGLREPQRVIGVVGDVAESKLTDRPAPARYYLATQIRWDEPQATLVLRPTRAADAAALLDVTRRVVQRIAPTMAVQGTTTMDRVLDAAVGPARQVMSLLTLLSALALALGTVGIYGVMSHFASRRKRDWAIRVALGLPGSRVVTHIMWQSAALVGVGIAVGAAGTAVLARLLSSLLFGVSSIDPLAFAAAGALLLVTGVAAGFVPARRAGTVDPALVMREQ